MLRELDSKLHNLACY